MSRATRLVYIAHPLGNGPDRAENIARAARWFAWAAMHPGVIPVASWIILASVWDETPELRARGILIDKQLIARCDEVWAVAEWLSPGMQEEVDHARACGVSVVQFVGRPDDRREPPHELCDLD